MSDDKAKRSNSVKCIQLISYWGPTYYGFSYLSLCNYPRSLVGYYNYQFIVVLHTSNLKLFFDEFSSASFFFFLLLVKFTYIYIRNTVYNKNVKKINNTELIIFLKIK